MYKFAVSSSSPVLFLQTYEKKEVIPLYQVPTYRQTSTDDGEEILVEVDEEDQNDEVCTREILLYQAILCPTDSWKNFPPTNILLAIRNDINLE
jgi:hypothetical protein